jgi:2-oxoglutarate dehydrogenase E1 component
VTLTANPSHLEAVDPVVEGETRAKQEMKGKKGVIPLLIHGDASVAGQGVVYETLQMGGLPGYETGGTIHIVINNQIGFTTLPDESRSTRYCTDIAKAFGAPVFHVNAEKPEECVLAAKMALQIRQRFHCDVFLDLNCYRKYGHNEGDEPAFTQPLEYRLIRSKRSIRMLYIAQLIKEGVLTEEEARQYEEAFKAELQKELELVSKIAPEIKAVLQPQDVFASYETKVPEETLRKLADSFCLVPEGFHLNSKIKRLLDERQKMMSSSIDWGLSEHLALASLLVEGTAIRLSGQDAKRATFSQRHAVWIDQEEKNKTHIPLSNLKQGQAPFNIFNSQLSEFAILGFEFGYSLVHPKTLTIWEAQYGDFANGAQVMIDQFISASEQKWGVSSNLTLFLPHGYEGQGPEHSSARLERFLQLCGHDNMFVVNSSTPAQLFHLLRRQAKLKKKKPLILFTPKALLRHPQVVSPLKDFSSGQFEEFLEDPRGIKSPRKILFCSGKVYYDLMAQSPPDDIAIIRIEQLYPFNKESFKEMMASYSVKQAAWVQEEPQNMGASSYIIPILQQLLSMQVSYIGREKSASTAAGSHYAHSLQLTQFLKEALS